MNTEKNTEKKKTIIPKRHNNSPKTNDGFLNSTAPTATNPPREHAKGEKPILGITHGDINGVGYEIVLKTFEDHRLLDMFTPVFYGSSKVLSHYKKLLKTQDFPTLIIKKIQDISPRKFNILEVSEEEIKIEVGQSTAIAGNLAAKALELACEHIQEGYIHAMITAPINKNNIQSQTFEFPGHTEYLTAKFKAENTLMIMACNRIRIGILTNHLPLKDVSQSITSELIERKLALMNLSLQCDFGIHMPKIAVLALNPHCGDGGVNGSEDETIIAPAVEQAYKKGILAFGPYPSDGFFGSNDLNNFDGVLALYHDQGMIPFKLLSFTDGINFTAGLPYVRTSPAHGTAYEIAGKNEASTQSFRNAIYNAIDIIYNRKEHHKITKNPLEFQDNRPTMFHQR